jgi:ribosome biogenesis GTPase A
MREQWFPGHMAKAKKTVKDNLQNVDVVIEVRDARVPDSTGNPDLAEILKGKPLVIALNKRDMADPEATEKWLQYFQKQGIPALAVNALQSHGIRELIALVRKAAEARFARMDARGRREQPVRIMIVGIPNVGKSQLINALGKRSAARTADRPGVTRGKQWIHIDDRFLLLDTPGILWPRQRDPDVLLKLDLIAALDSKTGDPEEIVMGFFALLDHKGMEQVMASFKLDTGEQDPRGALEAIGKARGILAAGGVVDREKAAVHVLRAFQTGKLGRFSFELPPHPCDNPEEEDSRA